MICPACDGTLHVVSIGDVELDVCKDGCGGIWFDRFELKKMDEPHEFTDEDLAKLLPVNPTTDYDRSKRYACPKCKDVIMMRHFHSVKREVEIDHCPKCAGHWLDEGEILKIRNQYTSEAKKKEAAKKYFTSLFDGNFAE